MGGGRDDKRRSDEGRGEDDARHKDRGRDDGRGNDGTISTHDESKRNGGAGAGSRKGGRRDDARWGDEGRGEDVTRHEDCGQDYRRGDNGTITTSYEAKGKEAHARGRRRRADATTSAGAARDGGRMTHVTRTADETTDEATTTKRKGTETQARRRGASDETVWCGAPTLHPRPGRTHFGRRKGKRGKEQGGRGGIGSGGKDGGRTRQQFPERRGTRRG